MRHSQCLPKIGVLIVALRLRPAYGSGGDPSTPHSVSDDIGCAQSGHTPINPGKFDAVCAAHAGDCVSRADGKKSRAFGFLCRRLSSVLYSISRIFGPANSTPGVARGSADTPNLIRREKDFFDLGWVPFLAASLEPRQFSDGRERALFERVAPVGAPRSR
jgi:hypothetical protein